MFQKSLLGFQEYKRFMDLLKKGLLANALTAWTFAAISVSSGVFELDPLQITAYLISVVFLCVGYSGIKVAHTVYFVLNVLIFIPALGPIFLLDDTLMLVVCMLSAVISSLSPFLMEAVGSAFIGATYATHGRLINLSIITYLGIVWWLVFVSSALWLPNTYHVLGLFWFSTIVLALFSFLYGRLAD